MVWYGIEGTAGGMLYTLGRMFTALNINYENDNIEPHLGTPR